MRVSTTIRRAYSEVDEFLSLLSDEQISKVPKQLRQLIKDEKDPNYIKGIDVNKPINEQDLMEESLAVIALLNLEFWCEDENEKERLRRVYENNEKAYSEVLQISFDADKIFSRTENSNVTDVVPYKKSFIKKIIGKIKKIFNER